MNQNIYKNECLKKRLLFFIRKHHNINNILFWSYLATSHYAKTVTSFIESQNLNFVLNASNVPNVPQYMLLKSFWLFAKPNIPSTQISQTIFMDFSVSGKKLAGKLQKSLVKPSWRPFRKTS